MDYDSSDEYVDDDEVEETVDLGVLPYQYEPRRRAVSQREQAEGNNIDIEDDGEGSNNNNNIAEDIGRLGNVEWCRCGNCIAMPTCIESVCCKEIGEVAVKIDEDQR